MIRLDRPGWRAAAAVACLIGPDARTAAAQQPFAVDDAGVTGARGWHLEISSQADALRPGARPARWQHVSEWEVDYGLGRRLEVGVAVPFVSVMSRDATGSTAAHGPGDASASLKWRLTPDAEAPHALAVSAHVEIPSGSRRRGLGSGLVDYGLNLVSEHLLHPRATWRVNGGALLAGNTQVGALGIRERGAVLTAGTSLVGALTDTVRAGAELTLAWSQRAELAGSAIGWQVGANIALRPGASLDAGLSGGWFDASPRWGLQLGLSLDVH